MGASFQYDGNSLAGSPPQTGINPNPPSVSYGVQQPVGIPSGKGGSNVTYPGAAGQPQIGMPNKYSNTVQSGDNSGMSGVSRGKGI